MSLFASLGQGDIWALSGISFASPINDLLDRGTFTLEDLLNEDELIQEVKAKNERLIDYLASEECIEKLLEYVITPAKPEDSDLRKFKYPYMSCEVICCEVPDLLHNLVEAQDGALLRKLFSFLAPSTAIHTSSASSSSSSGLDCYLAGYFEKILEMLFRKLTHHMMYFFNAQGIDLLEAFLSHVENYSIMQIIQRLMLPHLPFAAPAGDEDGPISGGNGSGSLDHCNWSFLDETCELLVNKMLQPSHPDVPLHISDMLITVLQLSPPETLLVKYLSKTSSIQQLLKAATLSSEIANDSDVTPEVLSNIALAATSVLESLISRLYESGFPLSNPTESDISQAEQELFILVNEQLNTICEEIAPEVVRITNVLVRTLANSQKEETYLSFPTKKSCPRLGHHGLQVVKLVEALTRVGNLTLDQAFCDHRLFEVCLEIYLAYEYNSIMHLSIQRIFVNVFEGATNRLDTQAYVCGKCDLLRIVMKRIGGEDSVAGVTDPESDKLTYFDKGDGSFCFVERHSSIMGNIILIAHAAFLMLDTTEDENPEQKEDANGNNNNTSNSNNTSGQQGLTRQLSRSLSSLGEAARLEIEQRERAIAIREKIADADLLAAWDEFSQTKLRQVLDHQTMGSYEMPTTELATSQDDPMKLGVDLDVFEEDDLDDDDAADDYDRSATKYHMSRGEEYHNDPDINRNVFSWSDSNHKNNNNNTLVLDHSYESDDAAVAGDDDDGEGGDSSFSDSGEFADFADFADFEGANTSNTNLSGSKTNNLFSQTTNLADIVSYSGSTDGSLGARSVASTHIDDFTDTKTSSAGGMTVEEIDLDFGSTKFDDF